MSFEFDGEKYKKASTHQKEWGAKLLSEFDFQGTEHILDLGCGDGEITATFGEAVPVGRVLGIDASSNMIQTASKSCKSDNVDFQLLDIAQLLFEEEFDLVVSNAALHWVKDHNSLLRAVFKALKKGGVVRVNFAADGNCATFFKVVKEVMALPPYRPYFDGFVWPWFMPSVSDYETLLKNSLFTEFSVWGENADRNFPDTSAMVKWIDQPSLVPFLQHISSADEKRQFRDRVVNSMIERTQLGDGSCFETFRRINLKAIK